MTLTLLSVPPPKADCQDTQVCKLNSEEKLKITKPVAPLPLEPLCRSQSAGL
jgi:hypothetical protein